jgi:hypothetical protein
MDPLRSDDAADDSLELNPKGRRRRRRRYRRMQIALTFQELFLTQYPFPPPPYSPPSFDPRAWSMPRPNAAGRAASIWQIVLGSILLLIGTCVGAFALMPEDIWQQVMHQQQSSLPAIGNTSMHAIRMMAMASSVVFFGVGVLLLVLAIFVRRESRGAIIASIVVCGLFGSFMLTDFLTAVSNLSNPTTFLPVIMLLAILALSVITILNLVKAMRSSGSAQAQAMQQAYYWMQQQQQQAGAGYGQGPAGYGYGYGYGYGQSPTPQAPPPPPPSQQAPPPLPPQIPPPSSPGGEV